MSYPVQISTELVSSFFIFLFAFSISFEFDGREKSNKHLFSMLFSVGLLLVFDAITYFLRGNSDYFVGLVLRVSHFFTYALGFFIILAMYLYTRQLILENGDDPNSIWNKIVIGIVCLGIGLLIISQFTDMYYYLDATNTYHRADLYIISLVPICAGIGVTGSYVFVYRNSIKRAQRMALYTYLVFPIIGMMLGMVFPGLSLINHAVALTSVLVFGVHLRTISQNLKEAIADKDEALIALEEASKAKDVFLKNVSHEIRTPLHSIKGNNNLIANEKDIDAIKLYSTKIDASADILLTMFNNILDYTVLQNGDVNLVEKEYIFKSLIRDIIPYSKSEAAAKNLSFFVFIDEKLPEKLVGDYARISQICFNLLSNAVKFTEKGSISVSFKWEEKDEKNGILIISVKDSGIGLRPEELEKISESFSRANLERNQNISGLGLGAAINAILISKMNGSIQVDSQYEKGTNFTVRIPQQFVESKTLGQWNPDLEEINEEEKKEVYVHDKSAKILAVDDSPMNLMLVKKMLNQANLVIETAKNGLEALEILEDRDDFDLVLMDMMMPVMDGLEALKNIKEKGYCKNAFIISFTADAVAGAREKYLSEGFDDYFEKPYSKDKLVDAVSKWLEKEVV